MLEEIKKELAKFQYLSEELAQTVSLSDNQNKIRIAEIDKEITSLLSKVADANKTLMNYLNNRIEELDKEKQSLLEKLVESTANKPAEKLDKITDYISKWTDLSLEDKQKIADILIKVIYIDEDVIEIEWNI